ncbi:hypothetical protein SAMN05444149_105566 [Pseudosulfitobacter pseudonitzschiae]|nr:hypothetical protein SAMN05444149_105566 [Pseudosulfitobacter pseudonitzschiae]
MGRFNLLRLNHWNSDAGNHCSQRRMSREYVVIEFRVALFFNRYDQGVWH